MQRRISGAIFVIGTLMTVQLAGTRSTFVPDWTFKGNALAEFQTTPRLMQRFHKARLIDHFYWDNETGELKTMRGRVRLCPYYFVDNNKVKLGGALATIVPADKKLLHGMRDAILAPTVVAAAA